METSLNNKCKAFTSLEQSKVLAGILPLESADMYYLRDVYYPNAPITAPRIGSPVGIYTPCWSLAALLDAMPPIQELCSSTDHYYRIHCMNLFSEWHENAIDSCVEMIVKLHEKGLL